MERAAKLIRTNKYSKKVLVDDDFARAVWPAAVGKAIAAHTVRVRLVRNKLIVEVEDLVWQRQLFPLTRQILDRLAKVIGSSELVQDLDFRVAIPKHGPARVEAPGGQQDEADTISDPVLKRVYRLSRKRVTA